MTVLSKVDEVEKPHYKMKRIKKVKPPSVNKGLDPNWYDTVEVRIRLVFKNKSRRVHRANITTAREAAKAAFVASLEANGYSIHDVESTGQYGYTKAV